MESKRLFSELVQKNVPYYQRLHIVRFIYFRIRFNIRDDGLYIGQFMKREKIDYHDYIKLLYGYFKEDPYRKPFLIHQKITYIFVNYCEEFEMKNYIPRKHLGRLILSGNVKQVSFAGVDFLPIDSCVIVGEPSDTLFTTILKISPQLEQLYYYEEFKKFSDVEDEETEILQPIRKLKELKFRVKPKGEEYKSIFRKECQFQHLRFPHHLEVDEIANLPCLQRLSLSRGVFVDDERVKSLTPLTELHTLELNECNFTMDGFLYILKHMKKLRHFKSNYARLEEFPVEMPEEQKKELFVFQNESLRSLSIQGVKVTLELVDILTNKCTSLSTIDIGGLDISLLSEPQQLGDEPNPFEFLLKIKNLKKLLVTNVSRELSDILDRNNDLCSLAINSPTDFYINSKIQYLEISRLLKSEEDLRTLRNDGKELMSLTIRTSEKIPSGKEDVLIKFIRDSCPQILQFQFRCPSQKHWWGTGWKKWFRNINM